jgi:inosose dehydratase
LAVSRSSNRSRSCDGIVGVEDIAIELLSQGFDGPTTLEIAGEEAVKISAERLRNWTVQ